MDRSLCCRPGPGARTAHTVAQESARTLKACPRCTEGALLVCAYPGAAACVVGALQGVQEHPERDGACREQDTPQLVGASRLDDGTRRAQLGRAYLQSRTGRAGSPLDVDSPARGSGAERRSRRVGLVCFFAALGACEFG